MHQGTTFFVDELDWDRRKAFVRRVNVDYYTDAIPKNDLVVEHCDECMQTGEVDGPADAQDKPFNPLFSRNFGDVRVNMTVPKFKKVKFETQESIGYGEINLPQYEFPTQAAWWTFLPETKAWLENQGLDLGASMRGLAAVVGRVAAFHVMSDYRDLPAVAMVRSPFDQKPTLYLYGRVAGGVGLARRAWGLDRQIFAAALKIVEGCSCREGCPCCVGPIADIQERARTSTRVLLRQMNTV
jgi:DEAD/DEAH box helicase domain-containing protein